VLQVADAPEQKLVSFSGADEATDRLLALAR
jgi:hypothetical protein